MKVIVIGIGLLGGSFALEIKSLYPKSELLGLDKNPDHLQQAIELGLIDRKAIESDLLDSQLVLMAIPVHTLALELPSVLDKVGDDTLVIDVGSTKEAICQSVKGHPKRRNFMATHPIAGTEYSGPMAAHKGLLVGKTNIICEVENTAFKLQELALDLFKKLGMRIRYMDPVSHDRHIAYVSHLSHISSFMLGKTVLQKEKNDRDIFDLAGSGFESTVRLAKSSPEMWVPIFGQNRSNVLASLDAYIENLTKFQRWLEMADYNTMKGDMEATNRIRKVLEKNGGK